MRDRPGATAGLKGVAAAAVGLILFTVVQLSEKSFVRQCRPCLYGPDGTLCEPLSSVVLWSLIGVGILAILWHYPRHRDKGSTNMTRSPR